MESNLPISSKSRTVALALSIISLHRVYVGKWGSGLFQFILSVFLIVGYAWVVFDIINLLRGKFQDKNSLFIKRWSLKIKKQNNNDEKTSDKTNLQSRQNDDFKLNLSKNSIINLVNDTALPEFDYDKILKIYNSTDMAHDEECFNNNFKYFTFYLLCGVAYYGDGKINEKEVAVLKHIGTELLNSDLQDKELCLLEILAKNLDYLKYYYLHLVDENDKKDFPVNFSIAIVFLICKYFLKQGGNEDNLQEISSFVCEKVFELLSCNEKMSEQEKIISNSIQAAFSKGNIFDSDSRD